MPAVGSAMNILISDLNNYSIHTCEPSITVPLVYIAVKSDECEKVQLKLLWGLMDFCQFTLAPLLAWDMQAISS